MAFVTEPFSLDTSFEGEEIFEYVTTEEIGKGVRVITYRTTEATPLENLEFTFILRTGFEGYVRIVDNPNFSTELISCD